MRCVSSLIALAGAVVCASSLASASDGLRVAAWNISNYTGGNTAQVQTAVYASFEGRSLAPDVLLLQEMRNASAVNALVSALNSAPGSPGDWAAAQTFVNSSINTGLIYRTSKVDLLDATLVDPGSGNPNQPRNIVRYDLRLDGYASESATIAAYPVHMKAGSGSTDQARRLNEANDILADVATLPAERHAIFGGDTNIQSSSQAAHRALVGSSYNTGVFRDPIRTPGNWNNNGSFRFVHTQDPSGAGGMDDRHDQVLLEASLVDGEGFDYIGNPAVAYSTVTWDDPNHSYRSWGNDGSNFNGQIATTTNAMVGPDIAIALRTLAGSGGHLPVFCDLRVPAVLSVEQATIDLGEIPFGAAPGATVTVSNAGDTVLWGPAGIDELDFTLATTAGLVAPGGSLSDNAGGPGVDVSVTFIDSARPMGGPVSETLTIDSDAADAPSAQVTFTGTIVGCSPADLVTPFGQVDFFDVLEYLARFDAEDPSADLVAPFGSLDFFDVLEFLGQVGPCP